MEAFVLWTGGKDSCLALHEAEKAGYHLIGLVTFIPAAGEFLAHPLSIIKLQAQALCLPHLEVIIEEPYEENYRKAIVNFKKQYSVDCVVTGDIDLVDYHPNWIRHCAEGSDVSVFTPLWEKPREFLLHTILHSEMDVRFSCLRTDVLNDSWINKKLDFQTAQDLLRLHESNGIDPCGENGEFHTIVLDAPLFKQRISIDRFSVKTACGARYMEIGKASLSNK